MPLRAAWPHKVFQDLSNSKAPARPRPDGCKKVARAEVWRPPCKHVGYSVKKANPLIAIAGEGR